MTTATYETSEVATCGGNIPKVVRYGWVLKDIPGEFLRIDKQLLNIDHEYQRDKVIVSKIRQIQSEWSWAGCGCILVAMRPDGSFWVFDGQHRVLAARNRADIRELPCMVFECNEKTQEAAGFLVSNSERKPVSALDKFKALVMTGDQSAKIVSRVFSELGVVVDSNPRTARQLKCVGRCLQLAAQDAETFEWALQSTIELSGDLPIHRDILDGLFWVERRYGLCGTNAFDQALRRASRADILESISKFGAAEGKRGEKVCGRAILKVLNKYRRTPHRFGDQDADD
jgi:hypothetical protein